MSRLPVIAAHVLALSLAGAAGAPRAHAQSSLPQTVVARGLYEQALAKMEQKDHEAACLMLEEALRLEPGALGARLSLAECYEAAGRFASAWGMYGIVEQEAIKAKQEERRLRSHERAEALRSQLAYLAVEVPLSVSALPGLEIRRDGVLVGPAQWGVPLPADKGSHVIVVTAQGRRTVSTTFEILANGVTAQVTVSEPPPLSAAVPWWDEVVAPAARARSVQRSALEPAPPLPRLGAPVVELMGPPALELWVLGSTSEDSWRVCGAPCDQAVDGRAHQEFFLWGKGILRSARFRLDDRQGRTRIEASPASSAGRAALVFFTALGGSAALACGAAMAVVAPSGDDAALGGSAACFATGLVTLAIGIPLLAFQRTTFSIASAGAGGLVPAFRF